MSAALDGGSRGLVFVLILLGLVLRLGLIFGVVSAEGLDGFGFGFGFGVGELDISLELILARLGHLTFLIGDEARAQLKRRARPRA